MDRRRFLSTIAALAAGPALAARARGGPAPAPPPDSLAAPADSTARDTTGAGERALSVVAGGDVVLGYNLTDDVDRRLADGEPREYLYPQYFAGVREVLDSADLAVVNLECPFTTRGKRLEKNFNFRARPELVEILELGSVDAVTMANNHLHDFGDQGVRDTLDTLDRAGIAHFGGGMSMAEARRPAILERDGLRVGFVGHYFQARPDMREPIGVYATDRSGGAAGCYEDPTCIRAMVEQDVRGLVGRCDFPVAFFHWGWEGHYEVRDYQIELAHLCVDLGCRAVLGAHPHRIQGIEVYRGVPIFYSLGNLVYGGIKDPSDTLTGLARLELTPAGTRAQVVPVRYTTWPELPFRPVVLGGEAGLDALRRIAQLSERFDRTLPQLETVAAAG